MSRKLYTLLGTMATSALLGQLPALPADSVVDGNGRWRHSLQLEAWGLYNANTLYNELLGGLWRGDELDRAIRERSADALKGRNSLGYDLGARVTWTGAPGLFGKTDLRPLISVGHTEQLGLRFTEDLYRTTFFGNAAYEDRTAELGPSAFTQMRYQSIGAGIHHARTGSYVRLDLLIGQYYASADIAQADLYTGIDGRVIRADLDATYQMSDTAGSEWGRNNGAGAALSAGWNYAIGKDERTRIGLRVYDLGFIRWNDEARSLTKDTLIEFQGFEVVNVLDLDNVILGEDQLLDTLGIRYRPGNFTKASPFLLAVELERNWENGWYAGLRVQQRYIPGYVPHVVVSAAKRVSDRALLGTNVAYGGHGGLLLGLGARCRLGNGIWVDLSTPNVLGFALGKTRGIGLSAGLSFGF